MFELNSWQIHSHVFTPFQFPGGWPLGKVGFKSQSRPEFVPFRKLFLAHPQLEQCQAMMILKGFYLTACFYPFGDLILGLPGHLTSSVMVGPRWMRGGEIREQKEVERGHWTQGRRREHTIYGQYIDIVGEYKHVAFCAHAKSTAQTCAKARYREL